MDDVIKFVWAVGPEGIDIPGQCPLHINLQSYDHFFGWLRKIVLTSGKPLRNFNVEMADGSNALRFHDGAAVPLNMLANRLTQLGILECKTDSRLSIVGNGAMGRVGFEWKQARLFSISARIAGVDILVHDRSNTWIFSSNAYIGHNGTPWQRLPGKRA